MQQSSETPKSLNKAEKKPYVRVITVNGKDVEFIVNEAIYAKILDEEMLLDKVAIDFMIDEIASAIKNNPSRNHPIPTTVLLSQEKVADLFTSKSQDFLTIADATNNKPVEGKNLDMLALSEIETQATLNDSTQKTPSINLEKSDANPSSSGPSGSSSNQIAPAQGKAPNGEDAEIEDTLTKASKTDDFLKIYKPKYSFDDVYVDPIFKRRIVSALILAKEKKKLYEDWGLLSTLKNPRPLVLNFYGPPGTGKSMMAEAIAMYLCKDVFLVNYSELESGTPGETPKNIVKCFKRAHESNAVLIFDEADSFLGKRLTNVSSAADYSVNITRSVMLIELEKFDGVIVFTTNFISNYDIAFKRRILASLEFKLPDEKGRAHIWQTHIPKKLPLSPGITPMALAYKYGGTTGADIKDIVLFAAVNCLEKGRERLSWEDFDEAYQAVKNRYAVV